ncbi:MAG TPA: outer membrane protein assembly factor BamD, partial [Acinetobacter sp.]|nr:outer membrane protein assembly factor BamD [Acinetobacter sp.]
EGEQRSLTNRLSFGLIGKSEVEDTDSAPVTLPQTSTDKPSWTNRLSFGVLDKPEVNATTTEQVSPTSNATPAVVIEADKNDEDAAN